MTTESPISQTIRELPALYDDLKDDKLVPPLSNRIREVADLTRALGLALNKQFSATGHADEIRRLIACMEAFTRVDFCRTTVPAETGRRLPIDEALGLIIEHGTAIEDTLKKLLDDAARDVFAGFTFDVSRLEVAWSLYKAMNRGWLSDIDPQRQLEPTITAKAGENMPVWNTRSIIPELKVRSSWLRYLIREATALKSKIKRPISASKSLGTDRNRDAFLIDLASCYSAITGDTRLACWEISYPPGSSPFMHFVNCIWIEFRIVALNGYIVKIGTKPNAKTVKKVLIGR